MPPPTELTDAQAQEVKSLTSREAAERFHIGYAKWRAIKTPHDLKGPDIKAWAERAGRLLTRLVDFRRRHGSLVEGDLFQ